MYNNVTSRKCAQGIVVSAVIAKVVESLSKQSFDNTDVMKTKSRTVIGYKYFLFPVNVRVVKNVTCKLSNVVKPGIKMNSKWLK